MKHKIVLVAVLSLVIVIFTIGLNEYVEDESNMSPIMAISFCAWLLLLSSIGNMTDEEAKDGASLFIGTFNPVIDEEGEKKRDDK